MRSHVGAGVCPGKRIRGTQDELIAQYGVLAAINTWARWAGATRVPRGGRSCSLSLSAVNYRPDKATRLYSSMRANVGTVYLGLLQLLLFVLYPVLLTAALDAHA